MKKWRAHWLHRDLRHLGTEFIHFISNYLCHSIRYLDQLFPVEALSNSRAVKMSVNYYLATETEYDKSCGDWASDLTFLAPYPHTYDRQVPAHT